MKKIIAISLVMAIMMSFTSCSDKTIDVGGEDLSSSSSTLSSSEVSEYPSSTEDISSIPSSEVSEIVSQIEKANTSSKVNESKPESSKPTASKPTESKPTPSEPPPPSSVIPESSKPEPPAPAPTPPPPEPTPPTVSNGQMKAVWLSFLEFQQFAGSSESGFTNKINTYFDTMISKGLNTVIAQVRPHGDSLYPSAYYPWSKSVSGTMGQGVAYDPLEIMIREAHARGLEFHAWINPYRTMNDAEMAMIDSSFQVKQWYDSPNRSDYMVQLGTDNRWWLKPGNQEVQQLIINGTTEIVQNYNVDGIHLDDYFYGGAISLYGDSVSQAKANTTALVKGLHDGIKAINSSVLFGISPAGGFRENNPLPNSDMTYLSTDLQLWCQNAGYIDYIMPQIYWGYTHSTQPYTMTLGKWENFVTESSVALYIGLAPYKSEMTPDVISSQINDITNSYKATGYCLFRYDHIHNLNLQ